MSDSSDVQDFIDQENARRGRGPESESDEEDSDGGDDPEGEGEEEDRLDRLKKRVFGDEEEGG